MDSIIYETVGWILLVCLDFTGPFASKKCLLKLTHSLIYTIINQCSTDIIGQGKKPEKTARGYHQVTANSILYTTDPQSSPTSSARKTSGLQIRDSYSSGTTNDL